jgi:hypothetical protein
MRNVGFLHCVALGLASVVCLAGCAGGEVEEEEVEPTPDFPAGQGQLASGAILYPAGPVGVSKGSVVSNYQFIGYGDFVAYAETMQLIQLADFYNPTGIETYPDDTKYPGKAGKPKPTALLIDISASWCVPCQEEAKNVLPGKYEEYQPEGGEFLMQLAEGPAGDPATAKNLGTWTTKYDVNYPSSIDPSNKISALFNGAYFPTNILIDTRTMEIVRVVSGAPDALFWSKFEQTMTGE